MKNTKYIFCIALSLGIFASYAQPSSLDNTVNTDRTISASTALIDSTEDPTIQNDGKKSYLTTNISSLSESTSVINPEVKVYPEPFSGIVSVDLSSCPDAKICLYFESGKCIKYQDCQNEKNAIFNLKNEPKGLYFMEIVSNGKKIVKKVDLE